jgi:23S rRNA pseudouridine1911/1915/1917 synthase
VRATEDFRPEHVAGWLVHLDAGLAVVNKPAGLLSQPGPPGEPDLVTLARRHLGDAGSGVLHRLDRNVSGLVLLARSAEVARFLSAQMARGEIVREYVAIVRGRPVEDRFVIDAPLAKDPRTNIVQVAPGGEPARTEVEVEARAQGLIGRLALLRVRPISGRSHQIRVHLAHRGLPIVGDPKYGVGARALHRPLLHASRIELLDERSGETRRFEASPPFQLEDITTLRRLERRRD